MQTQTVERELTAQDRCDRCGARATSLVRLKTGGELLFCLHHHNEYWPALTLAGAEIQLFSEWLQNS